jgi:hypothetical protein
MPETLTAERLGPWNPARHGSRAEALAQARKGVQGHSLRPPSQTHERCRLALQAGQVGLSDDYIVVIMRRLLIFAYELSRSDLEVLSE